MAVPGFHDADGLVVPDGASFRDLVVMFELLPRVYLGAASVLGVRGGSVLNTTVLELQAGATLVSHNVMSEEPLTVAFRDIAVAASGDTATLTSDSAELVVAPWHDTTTLAWPRVDVATDGGFTLLAPRRAVVLRYGASWVEATQSVSVRTFNFTMDAGASISVHAYNVGAVSVECSGAVDVYGTISAAVIRVAAGELSVVGSVRADGFARGSGSDHGIVEYSANACSHGDVATSPMPAAAFGDPLYPVDIGCGFVPGAVLCVRIA